MERYYGKKNGEKHAGEKKRERQYLSRAVLRSGSAFGLEIVTFQKENPVCIGRGVSGHGTRKPGARSLPARRVRKTRRSKAALVHSSGVTRRAAEASEALIHSQIAPSVVPARPGAEYHGD